MKTKLKTIVFIATFFCGISSFYAQNVAPKMRWVKTFGGTKNECPTQILNINNHYYIAGITNSNDYGFSDSSTLKTDGFLSQLDLNGNQKFIKTINKYKNSNELLESMVFLNDSSIITGGVTDNWGGEVIMLDKYNLNGDVVLDPSGVPYKYYYTSLGLNKEKDDISNMYSDGKTLTFATAIAFNDYINNGLGIAKFDSHLKTIIAKKVAQDSYIPLDIKILPNNGFVIVGFKTYADSGFICFVDSMLSPIKLLQGIQLGGFRSALVLSDSSIVATGYSMVYTGTEIDYDIWIRKWDKNSKLLFNTSYGGNKEDQGFDLNLLLNNNILISGHTNSTDTANGLIYSNNGGYDIFQMEIDNKGKIVWWNSFGGKQDEQYIKTGNTIISNENIISTFKTNSSDKSFGISKGGYDVAIMKLQYIPEIISKLADSLKVCQNTDTIFALKETFWADSIQWYKNHDLMSNENSDTLKLFNIQPSEINNVYTCYIFNKYGKDSTQFHIAQVYPSPNVVIQAPENACLNSTVTASALATSGSSPYIYLWNDKNSSSQKTFSISSNTNLSVLLTDAKKCTAFSNKTVNVLKPYADSLAVVTYDQNSSAIEIAWLRTLGKRTAYYLLQKESKTAGVFETINDTLRFSQNGHYTLNNDIEQMQYTFRLISVDSVCNNQATSPSHSTIFLQQTQSSQDTTAVNLAWTAYKGLLPKTYEIWKNGEWVADINGTVTSYTYKAGNNKIGDVYQIKFKLDNPFDYSKLKSSTILDYSVSNSFKVLGTTSIGILSNTKITFAIYPNPNNGNFILSIDKGLLNDNLLVELLDLSGRTIVEKQLKSGTENNSIQFTGIPQGMYICKVHSGVNTGSVKVIIK